jgi:hypothetical protein
VVLRNGGGQRRVEGGNEGGDEGEEGWRWTAVGPLLPGLEAASPALIDVAPHPLEGQAPQPR